MFYELLATVFAGFAGGGLAYLLSRITRGAFPRSFVLAAAALCMIGFSIVNEYNWFPRSEAQLPKGVVVVDTHESQSWFRPWTYVKPYVSRFMALDTGSIQRNENVPHQRIVDVYLMARWRASQGLQVAVDCQMPAQTRLDNVTYAQDGTIESKVWEPLTVEEPFYLATCS